MTSINPRNQNWRFTWEAQSHTPNLKLFLFNSTTKPSLQCYNIQVNFNHSTHLLVTFDKENSGKVSLKVPIPKKILIDPDAHFSYRAFDDHIEVKLVLILPVDHPVLSNLNLVDDEEGSDGLDCFEKFFMDSDLKRLSSKDEVDFYCRKCSTRLTTTSLRHFVEMPSVNWREAADNWFGNCCCSFGGISEKLVNRFADAYTCPKGVCLLSSTSVTLCKDDFVGVTFADCEEIPRDEPRKKFYGPKNLNEEGILQFVSNLENEASCQSICAKGVHDCDTDRTLMSSQVNSKNLAKNLNSKAREEESHVSGTSEPSAIHVLDNVQSRHGCCNLVHPSRGCVELNTNLVHLSAVQENGEPFEAVSNRKSFLNGFLGDVFMVRSYNLSTDVKWKRFVCPQCSTLLGAYPCADSDVPVDDGIRLFKCYLSTSLPVGGSDDLFRKYNLEKMFTNQLMESAKDELSFRTIVRNLKTKSPMLQVVLVNPNSWCCTGSCSELESAVESASNVDLKPVVKLLFSDCSNYEETQLRLLQDWVTKNQVDEFFMMQRIVEKLAETMAFGKDLLPPSCNVFQNLSLSFMPR